MAVMGQRLTDRLVSRFRIMAREDQHHLRSAIGKRSDGARLPTKQWYQVRPGKRS